MYRTSLTVLIFFAGVVSATAQDVVTIGTGSAPSGGMVSIPVSARDAGGTPLGSDAGAGNRIQGFAFKVMFPTEIVASVTFARAGVTTSATPLYETALQGSGFSAFVVSFSESVNPIAFGLNAAAPGNQIGTLNVSLQPAAVEGSIAVLTIDPPSATLSNQAGSVRETVANGHLALVNGSVTVGPLVAPTGLVATAVSTSEVNADWVAVSNANHYEVWRSFNGAAYALAGSPTGATFTDSNVVAGTTYLYRVRAVSGTGGMSAFSSIDAATTILYMDDPLVVNTTIVKTIHMSELRTAVNAVRAAASLSPLASDPTVAVGANVRAQHITDLRVALAEARTAAGLSALSPTDVLTPGATLVKALHVQELRSGVK